MNNMIGAERDQMMLMPPSIRDWLPQDHLAVFVGDIVDRLNLHGIEGQYRGCGKSSYSPSILLSLLFYGYATGVFSSRQIEKASYDSVAFRYLSGDTHPDHDTICEFRRRFLAQLKPLFVQILMIAREMGCLKVGTIAIDGTKIKANASKHKAMSWGYACRLEKQLNKEIEELLRKAEDIDNQQSTDTIDIPQEIRFRQQRLAKIEEAKKALEQRARERHEKAVELWNKRKIQREAYRKENGKNPRGKAPEPPSYTGPERKDQYNFTDPDSRIMKSHGSFEQCQNAQAAVDVESLLVVGTTLTNTATDSPSLLPTLDDAANNIECPGSVLADAGYLSEENIVGCEERNVDAYIAVRREKHNTPLNERGSTRAPSGMSELRKQMWHKVKSEFGQDIYNMRMCTVEPVIGFIKHAIGFRQFSMRGIDKNAGEWNLVCLAYNLRRMFQLRIA